MESWIEELSRKRLAQRTNVFILETFDFKRLAQFKKIAKAPNGELKKLFKTTYHMVIDYNLQRDKIINLKNNQPLSIDTIKGPLIELDNILTGSPNMVLIDYIFMEEHARALVDWLAAWSQDPTMHAHKSSVLCFTADSNLFPETLRRLCYTITICPSTTEERREFINTLAETIKKNFAQTFPGTPEISLNVSEDLVQASSGLDLHSIETASLESFYADRKFSVGAFTEHKIKILKTYGLTYVEPQIGFSEVGGYDLLKTYIRNRVILPLRNPKKAEHYGVGLPRGIILFGPPGTGKTYFSEAIAKELGLPMIKLNPSDLLRGVVGESERRVRQITMLIESLAPVQVFIDEVDQIALARGKVMMTDSGVNRRITNMLLEWLGDRKRRSFIVGATNMLENMDFAFIRAGRVDEIILVLPPDKQARHEILKIHSTVLRKIPMADKEDQKKLWNELAEKTKMWSGAELEKLCIDAARLGMEQDAKFVGRDQFFEAMDGIEINVNERQTMINSMVATMKKTENVSKRFLENALRVFGEREGEEEQGRISTLIESLNK